MTFPTTPPRTSTPEADAGQRGRTTLAERTVERIAAEAVADVDNVGGTAKRLLGITVGDATAERPATVTATLTGERVTLDVRLSVRYPASVARTTEDARAHLVHRVGELTGLTVTRVDITVTALRDEAPDARRVR